MYYPSSSQPSHSEDAGMEESVKSPRPPRRVPMACTFCRKRKIKCTPLNETTCKNCHQRDLPCVFQSVADEEAARTSSQPPQGYPWPDTLPVDPMIPPPSYNPPYQTTSHAPQIGEPRLPPSINEPTYYPESSNVVPQYPPGGPWTQPGYSPSPSIRSSHQGTPVSYDINPEAVRHPYSHPTPLLPPGHPPNQERFFYTADDQEIQQASHQAEFSYDSAPGP